MKSLLTGGTGFVGRNLEPILDLHYQVTICGRKSDNIIRTDLSNGIPELTRKFEIMLHAIEEAHTYNNDIKVYFQQRNSYV